MRNFTSVNDVKDIPALIRQAFLLKTDPYAFENLGKRRTLVLLFFNPSLRTRLSTEKAAMNLVAYERYTRWLARNAADVANSGGAAISASTPAAR